MNEADALEIVQSALWTVVVASGPPIIAAMVVGIVIALFQALTQVQEMTLTFVPKMVAVFAVVASMSSFIGGQVFIFSEQVYSRVETGFHGGGRGAGVSRREGQSGSDLRRGFSQEPGG